MPKSSKRSVKELSKMPQVSGNAVGDTSLEARPDKFIGVKLRRIAREVKGLDSGIASKEALDKFGPVELASVPEKDDRAFEVAKEVPKKLSDVFGADIFVGMEACVKTQAFSLGRDGDGGDSGYLGPASRDRKRRSSALARPGSLEVGDKRESALIQEDQAGSKPNGLFLYEARRDASSSGSLVPAFPWLFWSAPGSSTPGRPSASKGLRCSTSPETSSERSGRYVSRSKRPSSNRLPGVLSPGCAPKLSSARPREAGACPDGVLASSPPILSCGRLVANAPRSLSTRPLLGPRSGKCGPVSKAGPPAAGVFRVVGVFHEVSLCPPRLPLSYRLNLVPFEW